MLEYAIMSVLYLKYFNKKVKKVSIVSAVLIFILVCTEGFRSLFVDQVYSFQAYGKVLVNAVIIVYCIAYFINLARNENAVHKSEIQLNTIIFVYYVITLLIFVSINFLINGYPKVTFYFWIFHSFIITLFYSSIALLIWQTGRTHKISPSGWQS